MPTNCQKMIDAKTKGQEGQFLEWPVTKWERGGQCNQDDSYWHDVCLLDVSMLHIYVPRK